MVAATLTKELNKMENVLESEARPIIKNAAFLVKIVQNFESSQFSSTFTTIHRKIIHIIKKDFSRESEFRKKSQIFCRNCC